MRRFFSAALLLAGLGLSTSVEAQNADARDYELGYFAPNNSVAINVYGRHEGAEKPRNYTATTGVLRATHLIKKGEWVFVPFDFSLPLTNLTLYSPIAPNSPANASIHTIGFGDLLWIPTIGTGITQNPQNHTHTWFALTPYVTIPTGNYATKRLLNTGGNRWIFRPQIMAGQRFAKAFTVEAFANTAIYGKNDEYRVPAQALAAAQAAAPAVVPLLAGNKDLEQKPSFAAAVLTGMDLSPTFTLTASYYWAKNGRQTVDLGLPDAVAATPLGALETPNQRQTIHTLRMGMGIRVEKGTQLLFQFNQDLKTEGLAPITRGFYVRVTHVFFPPPKAPTARPDFTPKAEPQPQPPAQAEPLPPPPAAPGAVQGPAPQ
ncbi:MAG: transporter [Polyangiales bacterium]